MVDPPHLYIPRAPCAWDTAPSAQTPATPGPSTTVHMNDGAETGPTAIWPPLPLGPPPSRPPRQPPTLVDRFPGVDQTDAAINAITFAAITPGNTYSIPDVTRRITICPSLVHQIDGFVYKLFGLRLERDTLAQSAGMAYCSVFGLPHYQSLSSGLHFFLHDPSLMPRVIATAAAHRACGVFVVPYITGPPLISSATSTPTPWLSFLLHKASFVFELPATAVRGPRSNYGGATFIAVLKRFGAMPKYKTKTHPERSHGSTVLPHVPFKRRQISTAPFLHMRVSAFADALAPTLADDIAIRRSEPWPVSPTAPQLPPVPLCPFNHKRLSALSADYPFPRTRAIALAAIASDLDCFVGDRTKPVDQAPRKHPPHLVPLIHEAMVKETEKGFSFGPFPAPLLPGSRATSVGVKIKNKYVELCTKIRITHAFNIGPGSLNDLNWCPKWLEAHFCVQHLADMIAELGHGTRMTLRDIPTAFKHLKIALRARNLHVTVTESPFDGSPLYWHELCSEFGFRPSEWGYAAVKTMILFCVEKIFPSAILAAFVDNMFQFHAPSHNGGLVTLATMQRDAAKVEAAFADLGIPIHERLDTVTQFNALGWDWNIASHHPRLKMVRICPTDKFLYYRVKLDQWARAGRLSVADIETAAGCMQWLASGFSIGAAYVGPLFSLRAAAKTYHALAGGPKGHLYINITEPKYEGVREALRFWATFFAQWDRICPIVQSFGPNAGPQAWGWVDASTTWGCGGILYLPQGSRPPLLFGFTHKWSKIELDSAECTIRASTGVLEALAIHIWLQFFALACRCLRAQLATDNEAVSLAFSKAFSDSPGMLSAMRSARLLIAQHHICLRIEWLRGVPASPSLLSRAVHSDLTARSNKIADCLSKHQVDEACSLAMVIFGTPLRVVRSPVSLALLSTLSCSGTRS